MNQIYLPYLTEAEAEDQAGFYEDLKAEFLSGKSPGPHYFLMDWEFVTVSETSGGRWCPDFGEKAAQSSNLLGVDQMLDLIGAADVPLWGHPSPVDTIELRHALEVAANDFHYGPHEGVHTGRAHQFPRELSAHINLNAYRTHYLMRSKRLEPGVATADTVVIAFRALKMAYARQIQSLKKIHTENNRKLASRLAADGRRWLDQLQHETAIRVYDINSDPDLMGSVNTVVERLEHTSRYLEEVAENQDDEEDGASLTSFIRGPLADCYWDLFDRVAGRHWKLDPGGRHYVAQGPFVRFATRFFVLVGLPVSPNTVGNAFRGRRLELQGETSAWR